MFKSILIILFYEFDKNTTNVLLRTRLYFRAMKSFYKHNAETITIYILKRKLLVARYTYKLKEKTH